MKLKLISYGIKNGNLDNTVNLFYDVRFLKNPYWDEVLRYSTGLDTKVQEYILSDKTSKDFLEDIISTIEFNINKWSKSDTYNVAIACTGGQHRSVTVVEYLSNYFKDKYEVTTFHRDVESTHNFTQNKLEDNPNYIPKVVCIGGGSGMSALLKGLRQFPIDLSAIVNVSDDGGSTGKLKTMFKMPAPGDVRRNILALSKNREFYEKLFNFRFKNNTDSFEGHPVGNVLLAALNEINDNNFIKAVQDFSKIVEIEGNVIPVSNTVLNIGCTYKDGSKVEGEANIPNKDKVIDKIYNLNDASVNKDAINAILEADLIVLSPGSLFTSIIPNLVFKDIIEAINKTYAKTIYVSNIMTQSGETNNFTLKDHVNTIEEYIGKDKLDIVIANNNFNIDKSILNKYQKESASLIDVSSYNKECILDDFIYIDTKSRIRHNSRKVAFYVFQHAFKLISN